MVVILIIINVYNILHMSHNTIAVGIIYTATSLIIGMASGYINN